MFFGGKANDPGSYSAIVEKVVRPVSIGTNPVGRVRRKFTFRAFVRYADGTAAADGT